MAMRRYSRREIEINLARAEEMRREGAKIHEVARALGVTDSTLYNWRKRLQSREDRADELEVLRAEIRALRKLVREAPASLPIAVEQTRS